MSTTNDQHGHPIAGSAAAVALLDRAIDAYLRFNPDVVAHATTLVTEHPDLDMGQALMAYLHVSSTDARDLDGARAAWEAMDPERCGERELAHREAIGAWLAGDWTGAAASLDALLRAWPRDVLALLLAHQLDFFLGDAANLAARPTRALAAIDPAHPHTAFVRGMQAFGLEESGRYQEAEDAGRAAVETHADDVWAIHAVVHVLEMQGRVPEGIDFLESRRRDWGIDNLFKVHNWWHLALFLLEAHALDDALAIYDAQIHNASSDGVPIEMLDASALLWRLHLDDVDTGGRFEALGDAWATRMGTSSWYVFNDLHLVMALVGAGRVAEAERHIASLASQVAAGGAGTNVRLAAEVGLPASRAVAAFARGDHDEVIASLEPIRHRLHIFGGSHAQRDALQRTLLESALRSGRHELASTLLDERFIERPAGVYGWTQRARLSSQLASDREQTVSVEASRLSAAAMDAHDPNAIL